jgi:hypothetical protein
MTAKDLDSQISVNFQLSSLFEWEDLQTYTRGTLLLMPQRTS